MMTLTRTYVEQIIITDNDEIDSLLSQIQYETGVMEISEDILRKVAAVAQDVIEEFHYIPEDNMVGYACYIADGTVVESWDSDVYDSDRSVMAVRRFDESFAVCPSCGFDFLYGSDHDCG